MSLQQVSGSKTLSGLATSADPSLRLGVNKTCTVGDQAASRNTGACNVIIGTAANRDGSITNRCVMLGFLAGDRLASDGHVCIGDTSLFGLSTQGSDSVAVGSRVAYASTVVDQCVYIGATAASGLIGSLNTCVGAHSGDVWNTGSRIAAVSGATSVGAYTTVTGAGGAVALGYSNLHVGDRGVTIGTQCVTSGSDSVVVGSGVTNSGRGCLLLAPPTNFVNTTDDVVNIAGLLTSVSGLTTLRGQNIALPGNVAVTGLLNGTGGASFVDGLATDTLSIGPITSGDYGSERRWTVAVGTPPSSYTDTSTTATGTDLVFTSGAGRARFTITDDFVPGVLNFTAQHRCVFHDEADELNDYARIRRPRLADLIGRIVVTTGGYCDLMGREDAIHIDEAVPIVSLCTQACDRRVFGVVSGQDTLTRRRMMVGSGATGATDATEVTEEEMDVDDDAGGGGMDEDHDRGRSKRMCRSPGDTTSEGSAWTREFQIGLMRFTVPATTTTSRTTSDRWDVHQSSGGASSRPRRRLIINALGEGGVWVCDVNGPLRNGDYITTSTVPGLGMRQEEPQAFSWTVGKITCDCDFGCRGDNSDDTDDLCDPDGSSDTTTVTTVTTVTTLKLNVIQDPLTGIRRAFVGCTYGR